MRLAYETIVTMYDSTNHDRITDTHTHIAVRMLKHVELTHRDVGLFLLRLPH